MFYQSIRSHRTSLFCLAKNITSDHAELINNFKSLTFKCFILSGLEMLKNTLDHKHHFWKKTTKPFANVRVVRYELNRQHDIVLNDPLQHSLSF